MSSELDEDLESMRRRIREEARRRRQEELQRRREKREEARLHRLRPPPPTSASSSSSRARDVLTSSSSSSPQTREEARRRRRPTSASSSSSGGRDFISSSSSPPSSLSSPPVAAGGVAATDASTLTNIMAANRTSAASKKAGSPTSLREVTKAAYHPTSSKSSRNSSLDKIIPANRKKLAPRVATANTTKTPRVNKLGHSDSDSEDEDLADMSRRLAEMRRRQSAQQQLKCSQKLNTNNSQNQKSSMPYKSSVLWSDDDSEEEMDVRQMIAKKSAEKRKRESNNKEEEAALSSFESTNATNNINISSPVASQEEGKSTNRAAVDVMKAAPPTTSLQNHRDLKSDKSTTSTTEYGQASSANSAMHISKERNNNLVESAASKQESHLQSKSLEVKAGSSTVCEMDDDPDSKPAASAIKVSQESPRSSGNSKRNNDKDTSNGKGHIINTTLLQSTVKPTIASATARSIAASTNPPSEKAALQQIESSASLTADPITGKEVRTRSNVEWSVHKQCLLVRTVGSCSPKGKVAGFDLDNTLVNWRCAGWPSRPEHYELWNSTVIEKLCRLHDDGYKLVIFSNQGGIKGAFNGKKSGTVKNVIDWIAKLFGGPLYAVCSTKTNAGYHKGNPGMWDIMEDYCNCGKQVRPDLSFFVGDADGVGDENDDLQKRQHQQTGTDKLFAENVGQMRNTAMKFLTPNEYFGPSNVDRRRAMTLVEPPLPALPLDAMRARAALLGGYLCGPLLLILIGVQGSGKSTFCQSLIDNSDGRWCQFSQDTIRNGRPGTRHAVEEAAREALRNGKNVVIDRMHLDPEQRECFVRLGNQCQVPVHGLVTMASKEEVDDRVTRRVNHPGGVEGASGARIAVASLSKLKLPTYDEGFALLNYSRQAEGKLSDVYQRVDNNNSDKVHVPKTIALYDEGCFQLPMITLGTMNIRKQETATIISHAMQIGIESIDTAPTYNNENHVGAALGNTGNIIVTIKVPKRCSTKTQAREEVLKSLSLLQCSRVDIILLHWPCGLIAADTLSSVWKELESMVKEGICRAIGVSNFNIMALKNLLAGCTIKPALNQVERHPLLPQYDLLEYCDSQDIKIQAHSPLGNGSKLLLENDTIIRVAQESKMSPAQVLLCWNLQQSIPVVTKFSTEQHGKEAAVLLQSKVLGLSVQQMKAIDNISSFGDSHRFVAPPYMYRRGAPYSWGDTPPKI